MRDQAARWMRIKENPVLLEKERARSRRFWKTNPTYNHWAKIKNKYGLTRSEFDRLWTGQLGQCCICETPLADRAVIDHDHTTGAVRGLLCGLCNTGLGVFRDTPSFLMKAAAYLRRNGPSLAVVA